MKFLDVYRDIIVNSYPVLWQGLLMTLKIFIIAIILGFILGLFFALMRLSSIKILKWIAGIYVDIIRCTPFIVQLFFLYFTLGNIDISIFGLDIEFSLERDWAGIVTIAVNAGAYFTEIIRAGIQSINKGQTEAARSLGLSGPQTMVSIILPQAFRRMFPTITSQSIISLKDTSLLTVIGIAELTQQGQIISAQNFQVSETWLVVGAIYFVILYSLSRLANFVERRFKLS